MAACDAAGGCSLVFPLGPPPPRPLPHRVRPAPAPYHPYGPPVRTVYLTSAFNLTSHLTLVVPAGVQLRGTEAFEHNCCGANKSTCDDSDCPTWPVLPSAAHPAPSNRAGDAKPAKHAFVRGFNLTSVTLTGGGEIHAGGGWWWCLRGAAAGRTSGPHAPSWCPAAVASGAVPRQFSLVPPRFLHLVSCRGVLLDNITFSTSPYWTLHLQYCNGVEVRNVTVFNANNKSIEAPNGDGIDVDSSANVHVHDSLFDVGDDALCVKSGADWLGRTVGRPSANVLFERIEVRNGHGLTVGSEASGGVRNVTFQDIFLNGLGGPQAPGERGAGVGGIHFKTGRGRGGAWENVTWRRIRGTHTTAFVAFGENHGSDYNQTLGPTNFSGTPRIRNLLIEDIALTDTLGPSTLFTLSEMPISNFTIRNATWSGKSRRYECTGWNSNSPSRTVTELFARGRVLGVSPPLGAGCALLPPLPPPSCSGAAVNASVDLVCPDNGVETWCVDLAQVKSANPASCCAACAANASSGGACESWAFNHRSSLCYLKSGPGRPAPSADTSGRLWPALALPSGGVGVGVGGAGAL